MEKDKMKKDKIEKIRLKSMSDEEFEKFLKESMAKNKKLFKELAKY